MVLAKDALLSDLAKDVDLLVGHDDGADSNLHHSIPMSSLCRHAMSHGNAVWGLLHVSSSQQQASWRVDMNEPVEIVTASPQGSLVFVVTVGGTAALLRGSDGRVLVTKKLESSASPIMTTWIRQRSDSDSDLNPKEQPSNGTHSLLLVTTPERGIGQHREDNQAVVTRLTLVRNLTSGDEQGNGDPPKLCTAIVEGYCFGAVTGKFVDDQESRLHLAGCSKLMDETLVLLEWDFANNRVSVVASSSSDAFDCRSGLLPLQIQDGRSVIMCSTYVQNSRRSVDWLDESSLESLGRYDLSGEDRVTAMDVLGSYNRSEALAFAVTVSAAQSTASMAPRRFMIHVLQLLVEDSMGLAILSKPHMLYTVPLDPRCIKVEIAASRSSLYSFQIKAWASEDGREFDFWSFTPSQRSSQLLARMKRSIELGRLDEASDLLCEDSNFEQESLFDDEYANVAFTEVPFRRLQVSLRHTSAEQPGPSMNAIQRYLRELVNAVLTKSKRTELALSHLYEAIDLLTSLKYARTLLEAERLLSETKSMIETLTSCGGLSQLGYEGDCSQVLGQRMNDIQDRLGVIRFLFAIERKSEKKGGVNPVVDFDDRIRDVKSLPHLFQTLLSTGNFPAARLLWHQSMESQFELSTETLVSAVLQIPPTFLPHEYSAMLEDIILFRLSVNHEYLQCLRSWACRMADSLDDIASKRCGLESAIHLLEVMERATQTLRQRASSFASECSLNESMESVTASRMNRTLLVTTILPFQESRRSSTVARLFDSLSYHPSQEDGYDADDDCVGAKLLEARCLHDARMVGLCPALLSLKMLSTVKRARSQYIVEKLIDMVMDVAPPETFLQETVAPFCRKYRVHYDTAILRYIEASCRDKQDESLSVCARAAQCCESDAMKGKSALCVLRAVQRRGISPNWLHKLSVGAVSWTSGDSGMQSEIKELSRLLRIEGIILKYCGREARRFFSVDNPRHSLRLFMFVTSCFNKNRVLVDALALCDAFSHLSRRDAVRLVIQHAMDHQDSNHCSGIITSVYARDRALAEQALVTALTHAEEILRERPPRSDATWKSYLAKARSTVCCMLAIIAALLEETRTLSSSTVKELRWILRTSSLASLLGIYDRVKRLQVDFDIYASLSELSCPNFVVDIASSLLQPIIDAHCSGESTFVARRRLAISREACSLLIVNATRSDLHSVWSAVCGHAVVSMVQRKRDARLLDLLELIGLFENPVSFELLPIANALCRAAHQINDGGNAYNGSFPNDGMTRIVNAAHLIQDRFLLGSRGKCLLSAVWFGSVLGTACEILYRCDGGVGELLDEERRKLQMQVWGSTCDSNVPTDELSYSPVRSTKLHATWHIGDGLLLAPRQSLSHGVDICLSSWVNLEPAIPALNFLRHSGAHFLSLRVLSAMGTTPCTSNCSSSIILRHQKLLRGVGSAVEASIAILARRCLGGSSRFGLTSGMIDPQMAAACLLSLPKEQAFIIYGDSIPSSLRSRNFTRLHLLAVVGVLASREPNREVIGGFPAVGWKEQKSLNQQCQRLAIRSLWCDRLQSNGIQFEIWQFFATGQGSFSKEREPGGTYATSLVPAIVGKLSTSMSPAAVMEWYTNFSVTFGVPNEVGIRAHIECCLAPIESIESPFDMRTGRSECETFVRSLLRLLEPRERRDVLRRCVANLESSSRFETSYERFELVLALYHNEIISWRAQEPRSITIVQVPDSEIELIDRRQEALKILMSYFHVNSSEIRPRFPAFFSPLCNLGEVTRDTRICGVLGKADCDDETFDPIKPLEVIFAQAVDTSILTALAPLSSPLGVPEGYIDVRFLKTRFHLSGNLPSFDHNVRPVLKKLSSESDRVIVAEWCAGRYTRSDEDEDRLRCLEFAFESAFRTSEELERLTDSDTEEQAKARETVRRLLAAKSALSDILGVKASLRSASPDDGLIVTVVEALISELDTFVASNKTPESEVLVDFLLSQGSLLAAKACIDPARPLPASQLDKFCSVILNACRPLDERYSYLRLHERCKRLAFQWLYHGDNGFGEAMDPISSEPESEEPGTPESHEADKTSTITFDLDMNYRRGRDSSWSHGAHHKLYQKTLEGERSVLLPSSHRELSMTSTRRCAIRIAVVLALTKHGEGDFELGDGKDSETTVKNSNSSISPLLSRWIRARSQLEQSKSREYQILAHCRELLGIAFAKNLTSAVARNSGSEHELSNSSASSSPKALTFAIRHRALLTASFLCPKAVELVVREERLIYDTSSNSPALKEYTFGSFVAKEIEELGLSLPHSDLGQLISMDYPSFTRTLRKDHHYFIERMGRGSIGRLLLLMVEMSLRSETSVQAAFVESIIREMANLHLHRTLLMAAERLCACADDLEGITLLLDGNEFQNALSKVSNSIVLELRRVLGEKKTSDHVAKGAIATVSRLGCVAASVRSAKSDWILETKRDLSSLLPYIEDMELIKSSVEDTDLIKSLHSVIAHFTGQHPVEPVSHPTLSDSVGLLSNEA